MFCNHQFSLNFFQYWIFTFYIFNIIFNTADDIFILSVFFVSVANNFRKICTNRSLIKTVWKIDMSCRASFSGFFKTFFLPEFIAFFIIFRNVAANIVTKWYLGSKDNASVIASPVKISMFYHIIAYTTPE